MNRNITKTNKMKIAKLIIGGALFGAALFFVPFLLLKVLLFFMVLGLLFKLFVGRRHYAQHWARLEYVRSLNEEEFEKYKNSHSQNCCGNSHHQHSPKN